MLESLLCMFVLGKLQNTCSPTFVARIRKTQSKPNQTTHLKYLILLQADRCSELLKLDC